MTAKTHLVKLLLQSNRLTLPSVDNRVISLQKRVREGGSKPWAVNSVPISLSWYGLPCLLISSSKYSTVCSHGTGRSRMHICLSPSLAWNESPLGNCLGWWGHPSTTVGRALCVPRVVGVTQAEWQVSLRQSGRCHALSKCHCCYGSGETKIRGRAKVKA